MLWAPESYHPHRALPLPLPLRDSEDSHHSNDQPGLLLLDEACHAQLLPRREAASDIPFYDQLEPLCPHQAAWRKNVFLFWQEERIVGWAVKLTALQVSLPNSGQSCSPNTT